jgi:hypothetical protein
MAANPSDKSMQDTAAGAAAQVSGAATRAREKAAEIGQSATETIEGQRRQAASGLESAASTIRERADQLPGGETASRLANSAADAMSSTAEYVRDNDLRDMLTDVEEVVKRNPGPALLAAAFVGFLVGRALSASD